MFVGGPTWETIGLGKQESWTHRSLLMRLLSQNTGKASGSQRLPSWGITLPKRPNDGELLTIQNPSPTHWAASLISGKLETILMPT
jgi:hypothetical protein